MIDKMTLLYGPEPIPGLWGWLASVTDSMRATGCKEAYVTGYIDGVRDMARSFSKELPVALERFASNCAAELAQDVCLRAETERQA